MYRLIFASVASLIGVAAQQAASAQTLQHVGDWTVMRLDESCSLSSNRDGTFVYLLRRADGRELVRIHDKDWKLRTGRAYSVNVALDGHAAELSGAGAKTSDGMNGFVATSFVPLLDGFLTSSLAIVSVDERDLGAVDLSGIASAADIFRDCGDSLPPRQSQQLADAPPVATSSDWLRPGDISPGALALATADRLRFRLTIDELGTPSNCEVLETSGSTELDGSICNLLLTRASFESGRNSAGEPVVSTYTSSVRLNP